MHRGTAFKSPWLPGHASVGRVLRLLEEAGMRAQRLSSDQPTCMDGTVDHVICITRGGGGRDGGVGGAYQTVNSGVLPDEAAAQSDHLLLWVDAEWEAE